MTTFELEDALVEFCAQNTEDFRLSSNETTDELVNPAVWSGFVPRDEVGAIAPGDIQLYPAVIVSAQSGVQEDANEKLETVSVNITIGCFDKNLDQQGYRDCCNILQRLKDRFREVSIIRERFPLRYPVRWTLNPKVGGTQSNSFPYFFAELQLQFDLIPTMTEQFDVGLWDGDVTPGRFNSVPIPTPEPNEHWEHAVPPTIDVVEHDTRWEKMHGQT